MSYDLWFWRETKPIDQTPEQICDCIAEEKPLDGIATLPIDRIKGALVAAFPDIQDEGASMTWHTSGWRGGHVKRDHVSSAGWK